ncbi:MAG: ATP-binding protein [Gammaproteobacteria bacterium]
MSVKTFSILIADDDDGDRKQVKRALKQARLSCEITEAVNMNEVITVCENQSFDCAILDYQMPGQNGLVGVELLHKKIPYMAIIMATGQGDEMVAAEAIKRGASDYIPKRAITAESIKHLVENALEKANLNRQVNEQREALENFAEILAHDLVAPIRNIRGFSDLITKAVEKGEHEKVSEYCQRVNKSGKRMQALIETLNEYNKVTRNDITFETVSLESALHHALENLSLVIKERNAHITHDTLPEVTGNLPQLIQLLQNLIGNGIKYCDQETPTVHISAEMRDGTCCVSIKDNGIGIPEKFYTVVFNPFKRLHSPNEEKYPGTGLGLATCKKIVERHGGNIWCESEKTKGTAFYFTISRKDLPHDK